MGRHKYLAINTREYVNCSALSHASSISDTGVIRRLRALLGMTRGTQLGNLPRDPIGREDFFRSSDERVKVVGVADFAAGVACAIIRGTGGRRDLSPVEVQSGVELMTGATLTAGVARAIS